MKNKSIHILDPPPINILDPPPNLRIKHYDAVEIPYISFLDFTSLSTSTLGVFIILHVSLLFFMVCHELLQTNKEQEI